MAKSRKKKATKKTVKKRSVKAATKKKTTRKKKPSVTKKKAPKVTVIGKVTHYFPHVNAAVVKLLRPLNVGDTVEIIGHTSRFTQRVDSMQMDHVSIQKAKKGDEIGLQVKERVREHDRLVLPK